ncbi:hypothetical protein CFIO01_11353 [Colletotrichum fioriniae PJ7]|uniref:Uncharacterized protein n=1 Tax=Colletotrichum fioriniae PJ7 TaxID=1445577 RepID=A0A010S4R7_9PEZI|nr:hypothetical protein CFIO01_11353 [Colletotrichum fioriniae PJ7]
MMHLGSQRGMNNPDGKSCRRAGLSRVDWAEDHIIAALESLSGPASCPICRFTSILWTLESAIACLPSNVSFSLNFPLLLSTDLGTIIPSAPTPWTLLRNAPLFGGKEPTSDASKEENDALRPRLSEPP